MRRGRRDDEESGTRYNSHEPTAADDDDDERGDESGSDRSSDDDGNPNFAASKRSLNSRLKEVFKNEKKKLDATPESVTGLAERIEARHLVQVKEYEAAPTDAAAYGKASFWDARYLQSEEVFEWYHPWPNLAPSLSRYLATTDRVLLCGCGNSDMGAEMCADGYEHVTGADISRVVIDQMSDKHPDLTYVSTDLTLTGFADGEFDVAIDKACLDAVSCHMEGPERLRKYLQEMDRITADEGAFVCISHAPPAQRLPLLEDFDADRPATMLAWDVHVDAIAKPTPQRFALPDLTDASEMYFIYVCLKNPDKAARKRWLLEKGERDRQKALAKALGRPRPPGGRGRGR